jgi:2-polyprenyl-3-methyl-5-hydroxy-6-metoxy-1,4-benzoquinol methylase/3-polyprenyl-4-hydroxybenzoate decarboxylase
LSLVRARVIRAYDHADATTLLGADGVARRFEGDSAALARAVLGFLVVPRTRDEILAHLSELAGAPVDGGGAVGELLLLLEQAGALQRGAPPPPAAAPRDRVRLVLGLTGGVAAAHAPALAEALLARGFDVRVAATRSALRFVGALALEALTHHPVERSLWPRDPRAPVPHLDLARWAQIVVVFPATATSLARLAQGSCGTVVSAAAISTRAPVLLVPSMNEAMYTAPSVQRNLEQLRQDGFFVAHVTAGVEVAEAPGARAPMIGTAPPLGALLDLIEAVAAEHVKAPAPSWDDAYRAGRPADLPWYTETLDADLAAQLARLPRGRLLDLGTGPGTAAIAAADLGFSVIATDVSPRALDLARARAGARPIVFVRDDVLSTRLDGAFDVVLDRGLFHVLPAARQDDYVAAVRRLVRPGGVLLLKVHAADEPQDHGTRRLSRGEVAAIFGAAFTVAHAEDTTFPGPGGRAPKAILFVLARRDDAP